MKLSILVPTICFGAILGIALIQIGCSNQLAHLEEITSGAIASKQDSVTEEATLEFDEIVLPSAEYMQLIKTFTKVKNSDLVPFNLPLKIDELTEVTELGIIVPHHLVASDALAKLFSAIKPFNPEIIVLVSPNHQPVIQDPVSSRLESMHVFNGSYTPSPLVYQLAQKKLLALNRELFKVEHGIYSILPFIGENSWDIPIIPLVMARNVTSEQLDDLLEDLRKKLSNTRVLWIASIDFSHYLPAAAAIVKDKQTMEWIDSRDYNAIQNSTSDHLDAPSALIFWLKLFTNYHQLWHSNSAEILGGGHNEPGTSYMIYIGY